MKITRKILSSTFFMLICLGCLTAADFRFDMWMDNIRQESEFSFVFDIHLKNTGTEDFVIESYSFGISYNRALLNGGAFSPSFLTYIEDSSDFEPGDERPNYPWSLGFSESGAGSGDLTYTSRQAFPHVFLTPLAAGETIRIGSFRVSLRDSRNQSSNPHPFACVCPELMLIEELCVVYMSLDHTGHPNYQANNINDLAIPEKVIHQPAIERQFAGYWFSGTGSWDDIGSWNVDLNSDHPSYTQSLPCNNANVVVAGQLHIPEGTHVDLTHSTPHGGQLTFMQTPQKSYTITLLANGDYAYVLLADSESNELENPLSNIPPGTSFLLLTYSAPPIDTFINWTDQDGQIISELIRDVPFTMPAHDVVLTANWASGQYPAPSYVSKSGSDVPSLTIDPGASLRVNTLLADLPGNNDHTFVHIKSDATGSGSLIHENPGVAARVDLFMPGSQQAWHLMSAPVGDLAIEASDFMPGNDDDFYLWDETGTWVNFKNQGDDAGTSGFEVHNEGPVFNPGKGYLVAYNTNNPAKSLTGPLHAGTYTATLHKSPEKSWQYEAGWNLLGNPYSSSIDFTTMVSTGILAENHAHVYNPNKPGGEGYESVTLIAPGQGFFVHAAHHGAEFVFDPASQTYGGNFLKSNRQMRPDKIKLRLSQGPWYDQLTIVLNEKASFEHNWHNASKLYSFNPDIPQLAGITSDGRPVSIQHIPQISEAFCIPLATRLAKKSEAAFSLQVKTGAFTQWETLLHDAHTNSFHPVSTTQSYETAIPDNEQPGRFSLCFFSLDQVTARPAATKHARIYSDGQSVFVKNPYHEATISLFALCGSLIKQRTASKGIKQLRLAGHRGPIIVELVSGEERVTSKAIIF